MNPALVWVDRYCGLKCQKQLVSRIFICFSNQQEAIIFLGFHLGQAGGWGLPLAIVKSMISGYFHSKKMKIGQKEHLSFSIPCLLIGHFRLPPSLCFKTRVGAQPLIWRSFFILMQIKLIFTRKVVHLASFWKGGFLELGSGLSHIPGNLKSFWKPL